MLTGIELTNFKNFKHADIPLGKFTVIVGANATGKSNIRDAMRFLHGLARGYTLAETVGGKYGDGGEHIWRGIRGGINNIQNNNAQVLQISGKSILDGVDEELSITAILTVIKKMLLFKDGISLDVEHLVANPLGTAANKIVDIVKKYSHIKRIANDKLTLDEYFIIYNILRNSYIYETMQSIRFLDLVPEKMRMPSSRGQKTLGDQGENLSSAIYHIYQNPIRKAALMEWIAELTPMDVVDFEFPEDQIGRILVTFVEKDGRKTSAYSASDGTLRFLCYAAALLTEEPAKVHFFEELDNGIHPSRLHLLVQLIEKAVAEGKTQVIATTHSPQMLSYLSAETLQSALLVYRLPGEPDAKVKRIVEIPDALRLIKEQGIARLHATGWLEDAVYLTEDAK